MVAVGIVIDRKCNIRCSHCCFSSHPKAEEHLTDSEIIRLTQEAVKNPKVDTISISGGEALLRYPLVIKCLKIAKDGGTAATIVSNGFWGQTPIKAENTLKELKESGLKALKISFDAFHQDLLKVERVRNILIANRRIRMPITLNVAVSRSQNSDACLNALGDAILGVKVIKFPIQKVGAASNCDDSELIKLTSVEDNPPCPGFEPTFHFDGDVYPCCSPTVFSTELKLGTVNETSVTNSINKIERNILFSIMRHKGFKFLLELCVKERLLDQEVLNKQYVDACDMCKTVFESRTVTEGLVRAILGDRGQLD